MFVDPFQLSKSPAGATHSCRASIRTLLCRFLLGRFRRHLGGFARIEDDIASTFDERSGLFTRTGNMSTGYYAHTATLLTDGSVLPGRNLCRRDLPPNRIRTYAIPLPELFCLIAVTNAGFGERSGGISDYRTRRSNRRAGAFFL
jgi:hypothetical protein